MRLTHRHSHRYSPPASPLLALLLAPLLAPPLGRAARAVALAGLCTLAACAGDGSNASTSDADGACLMSLQQPTPENVDPLTIALYEWRGAEHYLVAYDRADGFQDLFLAASCEFVCSPTGGFTGQGDGQCPTFLDEAKYLRGVWSVQ